MNGIGSRVRKARLEASMSQKQLGDKVGLTQSAIAEIEAGRSQSTPAIAKLAKALSVRSDWLEGEDAELNDAVVTTIVEIAGQEFARVPIRDIRLGAGPGAINEQPANAEPIDYHHMSLQLLRTLTRSPLEFIDGLLVDNDSMEKTLSEGDWVIIDRRQTNLARPGLFALNYNGVELVKRISQHLETDAVTLISDNPSYDPQSISAADKLHVMGRVIMSIRRH